ncbi:MAG: DNA primase [bacterium]|nr:DNA primase [bacterium]
MDSRSPVEEIKNRLDIVQVVGEYVQLQKAGGNFRAVCPFHSEKTPSFFVSPARQTWHCFGGCGEGGDMFSFVMKIEGIEFADALRLLAQKAGIELPKRGEAQAYKEQDTERKRLLEIMELSCLFFEKQLTSSQAGKEALLYLQSRGVTEESISLWRIGYAPDSYRALLDFLQEKGHRGEDISKAGLLVRSEGKTYDRFRGRIMFTIRDTNEQVVGFGGRIFGKKEGADLAKYINTSNTPLYDKSRILYGLEKAKIEIRREDLCILVEGYMDVIMACQAGFKNVVACSGTALTSAHLRLLKRFTNNLVTAFDMDDAGDNATRKSITAAIEEGFSLKVVRMPPGKDPADVATENPEVFANLVKNAVSVFDFYFSSAFSKWDKKTAQGKKFIADDLLPVIQKIPHRVEQSHWISRLAEELGVKEETLMEELGKVKTEQKPRSFKGNETLTVSQTKTRVEKIEEHVLVLLLRSPTLLSDMGAEWIPYISEQTWKIVEEIRAHPGDDRERFQKVFGQETAAWFQSLAMRAEVEEASEDEAQELNTCLLTLKRVKLGKQLDTIAQKLKEAEREKNAEREAVLLQEFYTLSRELN